jgi:hypothetical protein
VKPSKADVSRVMASYGRKRWRAVTRKARRRAMRDAAIRSHIARGNKLSGESRKIARRKGWIVP